MEDKPYELRFIIDPCPGCGLRSEMRVDAVGESCFFESTKLFLFRCENENCGHYAWSNFQPKELIGKEAPYLSEDVLKIEFELPLEVVSDFKEALSCFTHGNYNAAVVIARRLLERILLEKGAKCCQPICKMIADLVEQEKIAPELEGLCDDIRFFGKIGAHPKEENANESDASRALQFADFLVTWIYGRVRFTNV